MFDNTITLVGNLTDDPEFRVTTGGIAMVKFRLACSLRVRDRVTNEWRDGEVGFYGVTAWRRLAQNVHTSLRKGDRALVVGRLRSSSYERDGVRRTTIEVDADTIAADLTWSCAQVLRNRRSATDPAESGEIAGAESLDGEAAAGASRVGPSGDLSGELSGEFLSDPDDGPSERDLAFYAESTGPELAENASLTVG